MASKGTGKTPGPDQLVKLLLGDFRDLTYEPGWSDHPTVGTSSQLVIVKALWLALGEGTWRPLKSLVKRIRRESLRAVEFKSRFSRLSGWDIRELEKLRFNPKTLPSSAPTLDVFIANAILQSINGNCMAVDSLRQIFAATETVAPDEDYCVEPIEGPRKIAAQAERLIRVILAAERQGYVVTDKQVVLLDEIHACINSEYSRGAAFGRGVQRAMMNIGSKENLQTKKYQRLERRADL